VLYLYACSDEQATGKIPKAMVAVTCVMVVLSLWLQVSVAGQAPGLVGGFFGLHNVFPLSFGFGKIFSISKQWGTVFSIAPCFGSCVGYMYVAGRQLNAMARSGLMPGVLKLTHGENHTPVAAMLAVTGACLMSQGFAWHYDPYTLLFRMAISGSCVVYILTLLCYVQFKTAYSHMERAFVNPLGIASAVYGILCFALIEIAVLFILPLNIDFDQTIAFGTICAATVISYYAVVQYTQTFSTDEQVKFLRTYIFNGNAPRPVKL
jgi:amino acid transporter